MSELTNPGIMPNQRSSVIVDEPTLTDATPSHSEIITTPTIPQQRTTTENDSTASNPSIEQSSADSKDQIMALADQIEVFPRKQKQRKSYHDRIEAVKAEYAGNNPDDLQAMVVLTELAPNLRSASNLRMNKHLSREERTKGYQELTEFQFLATHFVIQNADKPELLDRFWQAAAKVAKTNHLEEAFAGDKSGIISAAGTYQALVAAGENPHLSRPSEDAFSAIDMWRDTAEQEAMQIKTGKSDEVVIKHTDVVEFPGLHVDKGDHARTYSPKSKHNEMQRFQMKIEDYSRQVGKPVEGYFIQVPRSQLDSTTGKPSDKLVAQLRQKLAELESNTA